MTHCSTTNSFQNTPKKAVCPVNGHTYPQVGLRTILHHVKKPWQRELTSKTYYFCDDPDCDVVYFGDNQQLIRQAELRLPVGQKSSSDDREICYCFDIRMNDLQTARDISKLKDYVMALTKDASCDCEIRNPSGRCCLRDFPSE